MSADSKRDIRYLTIDPGRISLHGVALTDAEYAVLRRIAERMKHMPEINAALNLTLEANDLRGLKC